MDSIAWKVRVQAQLHDLAAHLLGVLPGTVYGRLAAAVLTPILDAVRAHDYTALMACFSVVGEVGGNLLAGQLDAWKLLTAQELAIELTGKASRDRVWRDLLDLLLRAFNAIALVESNLADDERRRFRAILRQESAQLGSTLLTTDAPASAGDTITGKIRSDGDIRDSVIAIGANITQQIYTRPNPASEPTALRTAYLNRLCNQTNLLSLAGVDPKAASDEAEARLNLGAVYTALLTLPESDKRPTPGRHEGLGEEQRSAVAQLNRHPRLVLLGDPGGGKSTFVNFVTLCLAGAGIGHAQANLHLLTAPLPDEPAEIESHRDAPSRQPWEHGALLPVRVMLRDFAVRGLPTDGTPATAKHLWEFICAELAAAALGDFAPHLQAELMELGGLVLLDGLDEVHDADNQRTQIKAAVEDFAHTFGNCRILVTSRTYAYQHQDWGLANFVATVLAPFTTGQINTFVERWYAHIGEVRHLQPEDAQGRAALLKHALTSNDRLHALAERPLLLTLTASLHAWRGGSLPERREELYADAVDLLLDWWESQRVTRDVGGNLVLAQPSLSEWLRVDRVKVRQMLDEIAYTAHASQPTLVGTADIAEETLVARLLYINENEDVKPRLLMAYLSQRAGLLLPRGVRNYTFPHRTFQEYLAACYLTDVDYPDTLAELTRQEPERWREVALLASAKAARGTASALWSLVDALCFREVTDPEYGPADVWGAHLAGQCLLEGVNLTQISARHRPKVARVCRGLIDALSGAILPPPLRAQAGRSLARLGDTRRAIMTVEGLEVCLVPPGPFALGDSGDEHPLPYAYWIGRYPVSNAQFQAFVAADGYRQATYWPEAARVGFWSDVGFQGRYDSQPRRHPRTYGEPFTLPNHPVVGITWYEALAYTRWLEETLHTASLLPAGWSVQLPNEPEWEKAARGGFHIPTVPLIQLLTSLPGEPAVPLMPNPLPARRYPWGNHAHPERANYERTDIGGTNVLGCFPAGASPYGLEEMSGNVWEWTRSLDRERPYPIDETGQASYEQPNAHPELARVLRGGAFHYYEYFVRCAERYGNSPDELGKLYGFRIAIRPASSARVGA